MVDIVSVCEKCGKEQTPNAEKSNANWTAYDCNVACECGGKFVCKVIETQKSKPRSTKRTGGV